MLKANPTFGHLFSETWKSKNFKCSKPPAVERAFFHVYTPKNCREKVIIFRTNRTNEPDNRVQKHTPTERALRAKRFDSKQSTFQRWRRTRWCPCFQKCINWEHRWPRLKATKTGNYTVGYWFVFWSSKLRVCIELLSKLPLRVNLLDTNNCLLLLRELCEQCSRRMQTKMRNLHTIDM